MTWLDQQRRRLFGMSSGWRIPIGALLGGVAAFRLFWYVDGLMQWSLLGFTADGARAVVGTLAAAMLTFIVFAFSIMLIAIQLVSTSLSPRIIATVYQSRPARLALGLFIFTFIFSASLLGRIESTAPQLSVAVAVVMSVLSIGGFVLLVDHFGQSLRPVSLLSRIGAEGARVLFAVYPHKLGAEAAPEPAEVVRLGAPARLVERDGHSGIVVAFDARRLETLAKRVDCTIELIPQVGDFVAKGDPIFNLYGPGAAAVDPHELSVAIAFGAERTFPQDPLFAFRIIVDVAAKALSPAINDPTTAVLAIDQLHHLLRTVGRHHLDTGVVRDTEGNVRFVYRTPDWEDFLRLAVTEIRHYGTSSIQVVRRLRAMLENLAENLPPERARLVTEELHCLSLAAEQAFSDPRDRRMAAVGDSQGMGSPAVRSVAAERELHLGA
jgi:uncharacterized membrane protein